MLIFLCRFAEQTPVLAGPEHCLACKKYNRQMY